MPAGTLSSPYLLSTNQVPGSVSPTAEITEYQIQIDAADGKSQQQQQSTQQWIVRKANAKAKVENHHSNQEYKCVDPSPDYFPCDEHCRASSVGSHNSKPKNQEFPNATTSPKHQPIQRCTIKPVAH